MNGELKYFLKTTNGVRAIKVRFNFSPVDSDGVSTGGFMIEGEGDEAPLELNSKILKEMMLLCEMHRKRKQFIKSAEGYPFGIN